MNGAVSERGNDLWVMVKRVTHPRTAGNFVVAVLRGLGRFLVWYRGWLSATDKAYLIEQGSSPLNKAQHNWWCYWRRKFSIYSALTTTVALIVLTVLEGRWVPVVFFGLLSLVLAAIGRRPDKPVVVPRAAVASQPKITAEHVCNVVASATGGMKVEDWETIRVLDGGVTWDPERVWWSCRIEMPGTIPGEEVRKAKPGLMSGFGVGESQLDVVVDPANGAVVTLHGTQYDPWAKPPVPTPLLDVPEFNVWEQIPLAMDARGRRIFVSLVMTGWLIGSIPRRGKTNLMRLLALAAALDPYCDLVIFDLKGAKDWRMFAPLCRQSGFGRGDDTIRRLVAVLEAVQKEIDRRGEVLADLPDERCPAGHLTRDLAIDPELDLQPIVLIIDEVHWAIRHKTLGRKVVGMLEDIAKIGQYVGVWLMIATQKPDGRSIPTEIRDVLGTRAALKCMTRQASEAILGTEAYAEGVNAAKLPDRAGIAMLYGADDDAGLPETVVARVDLCDIVDATAVVSRATALREALGRLPSQRKSGEPVLLQHARQIQGERGYVPAAELLETLNRMPEYGETPWTSNSLGKAMRRAGFPSFSMNKETTGDPNMPENLYGRMGYRVLTRSEEMTTL